MSEYPKTGELWQFTGEMWRRKVDHNYFVIILSLSDDDIVTVLCLWDGSKVNWWCPQFIETYMQIA